VIIKTQPVSTSTEIKNLPKLHAPRNEIMAFDLEWVKAAQTNTSAIERRTNSLPGRRSVKKEYQAGWMLKAISCIDLTTLSGDDTAKPCAPVMCQGAKPGSQGYIRCFGHRADHHRRDLRLP